MRSIFPFQESLQFLSTCGLGEDQLLLRTPQELSDGQRYRFLLALAISKKPRWILADEFTATLDRTPTQVVALNVRRTANRSGLGFLLATTHEDVLEDLQPSLHAVCRLDGRIEYTRADVKKSVSFARNLWLSATAKSDWPYFARWHYRSHNLGITRCLTLLWHDTQPIGICLFTSPPLSLRQRNRYFGLSGQWSRIKIRYASILSVVMLARMERSGQFERT